MIRKKWVVSECNKDIAAQIAEDFSIAPLTAYLLASRGITDDMELEEFLDPMAPLMADPFAFADMNKAVEVIKKAIDDYVLIAVFGDYDADGVTATALLYSYLSSRDANVVYYIPDRLTEGYGLSCDAVRSLAEQGVKLIITVDNGVSAIEEAKLCRELGIELIITDHHKVGETLPDAAAVVDPHREDCNGDFKELSGVGVAFKLVSALEGGDEDSMLDEFGDLAAIGTIGDVVLLKGENRAIVRNGLSLINSSPRPGIKALLSKAGSGNKQVTSTSAAFTICPRINAAGRMGSAYKALGLLLSTDEDDADEFAEEIQQMNVLRQKTETHIFNEILSMFAEEPRLTRDKVIVVAGEGWHQGVIGIAASRIVDRYGKPAVVISLDGENARGSCRSIEGFSIFEALEACSGCLTQYGGHTLAAGCGLKSDKVDDFRILINEYADRFEMPFPIQKIDCRIKIASISLDILKSLTALEPFGAGNPQPCFGLYGVTLEDFSSIGDGKHLRMVIVKDGMRTGCVYFGMREAVFPYEKGDVIDLAVTLDKTMYNGLEKITVNVKNIKPSHTDEDKVLKGQRLFDKVLSGAPLTSEEAQCALPDRELQVKVFKHISSSSPVNGCYEEICVHIGDDGSSYCKVAVAVETMLEMGIAEAPYGERIIKKPTDNKVNLNDSVLMRHISKFLD